MFCYAFYLIGRYEFDMEPLAVRGLVRRWYFAAAITGLYVGSFESEFEQQLNDVSRLETADEFRAYFDRRLAAIMTDDYFSITLPSSLDANERRARPGGASSRLRSCSVPRRCSARPLFLNCCLPAHQVPKRLWTSIICSQITT